MYDAISIEYSFTHANKGKIGHRGEPWDADTWRHGSHKIIGKALIATAKSFEARRKQIPWNPAEQEPGHIGVRLHIAIEGLRKTGEEMAAKKDDVREREDYHWIIVGQLVSMVDCLLQKHGV